MESLLKAAWFTKRQFATKMDGIKFIKSHKKLSKKMEKMSDEIEEYKYQKVNEFEEYFDKFESEKEIAIIESKYSQKNRTIKKKENQKQALKNEMKAEIMKEILVEKNSKTIPKYNKDINYNKIDDLFIDAIKKQLSKKQIDEIIKMKEEAELAFAMLAKIANKLSEM